MNNNSVKEYLKSNGLSISQWFEKIGIEHKLMVKFVKNNREFKGRLKTKDLKQGDIVRFASMSGDEIYIKSGILTEMYREAIGGSYNTFELICEQKEIKIHISYVIGVTKKELE